MVDSLLNYLDGSGAITYIVLGSLSFYFILIFWIFLYKLFSLNSIINSEKSSLESLISRDTTSLDLSIMSKCIRDKSVSKEILEACEISVIREASKGISTLSIVSSTAPFIGLFGTVVGILESFAKFSTESKIGFSIIAPAISEALVATAAGIFVAIFAYTFHQIITRKVYDLNTYIKAQSKVVLSRI
jgi:flagellar motor component MotA